ncbi:MAG TPA: hypothetical protein DEG44_01010 [Candidatus Kerfeldbacteria bacterium]|nr:hypothetical protein [Candidatus Kerfeldbacteria bacterium]
MKRSRLVLSLRVTYIVLHTCLPVIVALIFVYKDVLLYEPLSYFSIALAVIGVMFMLSLNYTSLPEYNLGMVFMFIFPIVSLSVGQIVYQQNWLVSLAYITLQLFLSTIILGIWLWWEERRSGHEPTFSVFIGLLIVANIAALLLFGYSTYQFAQESTPWWVIAALLIGAIFEARFVLEKKSIN